MQVSWSVRENNFRDEVEASQGTITFSSGVRETDLVIRLRDDNVSRYLIILHLLFFIISFNYRIAEPARFFVSLAPISLGSYIILRRVK